MKLLTGLILLSFSLGGVASICGERGLMWENDEIIARYECKNATTKICATQAIWGFNNKSYFNIVGSNHFSHEYGSGEQGIYASSGKEGKFSETASALKLEYSPSPAVIIDSHKFRSVFEMSKRNGQANYVRESKPILSLSRWKIETSEKLSCKSIK